MVKNQIPDLLDKLQSDGTYIRNNAIKHIIKGKIKDERLIFALKDIIEIDSRISVRNFARSALDVFGIGLSTQELEVIQQYLIKKLMNRTKAKMIPRTNIFL